MVDKWLNCYNFNQDIISWCDDNNLILIQIISSGILVLGGNPSAARQSVEIWSTADQGEGSCTMNNYPREMSDGPTVNLVSDRLVACEGDTCEVYRNGSWQHLAGTLHTRQDHSSATTDDAVLLIGGSYSEETTEWIPVDGSPAHPEPFNIRHGYYHCTIQVNALTIVVTGGHTSTFPYQDYVTEYHLNDTTETPLTPLLQQRYYHACGFYLNSNNQQVREIVKMMPICYKDSGIVRFQNATFQQVGSFQMIWSVQASCRNAQQVLLVTGGYSSGEISSTEVRQEKNI